MPEERALPDRSITHAGPQPDPPDQSGPTDQPGPTDRPDPPDRPGPPGLSGLSGPPPKVRVAVAILLISGTLVPAVAVLALSLLAVAYPGGALDAGSTEAAGLIVPALLAAGFAVHLAVGVHRGRAAARWAAIGFLLSVAASGAAGIADGRVDPVAFLTVVALVGISPLLDPGVRAWCRSGHRPVQTGIAELVVLVGTQLACTAVYAVAGGGGGLLAGMQAVVGIALVCAALCLYNAVPGAWLFVGALMLIQPIFYAGLDGPAGRAELLSALGRLLLAGYVVLALTIAARRPGRDDEASATSG